MKSAVWKTPATPAIDRRPRISGADTSSPARYVAFTPGASVSSSTSFMLFGLGVGSMPMSFIAVRVHPGP